MEFILVKSETTVTDIEKTLTNKFNEKYQFKFSKAGSNVFSKALSGNTQDSLLVYKNAFHRTVISLGLDELKPGMVAIHFNDATLAPWLSFIYSNFGIIGQFIIQFIYGDGKDFMTDIRQEIFDNYETDTHKIDTSIKGQWKNLTGAFSNK